MPIKILQRSAKGKRMLRYEQRDEQQHYACKKRRKANKVARRSRAQNSK